MNIMVFLTILVYCSLLVILNVEEYAQNFESLKHWPDIGIVKLDYASTKTVDKIYLVLLSSLGTYQFMMIYAFCNFFKVTSKNFSLQNNSDDENLKNDPENQ